MEGLRILGGLSMTDAFDIVVVGSGAGGCAAALSAAGRGLSTCLLEKAATLGGGSASSYGSLWVPNNPLSIAQGLDDSFEEAMIYLKFVAGGTALPENLETYVREGARAIQRFQSLGMRFQLTIGLPDIFYPHARGSKPDGRRLIECATIAVSELGAWADKLRPVTSCPPGVSWGDAVSWGGFANERNWDQNELASRAERGLLGAGQALIGQFLVAYLRHRGTIRINADVESLVVEDGRVTGVRTTDGGTVTARRGIVLASGGYEGNADLVACFEGLPDWMNSFVPTNEGDAMVMATELGGAVYRSSVNHSLLVGCAVPGDPDRFFSVALRGLPWPGAIAVNDRGARFCDESSFQDVAMGYQKFDRARRRYVNVPAFMVFDDRFRQRYPIAGGRPGAPAPDWVVRADTLTELAGKIAVDAAGLEETVRGFNRHAADGEDPVFGRGKSLFSKRTAGDAEDLKGAQLAPLETPPYYAIRLKMGGICSAGVLTDMHGAVKHVRGHSIPGLYACGNAAAPSDTGVGYQGGTSLGSGVIFGFLAVEHAAMTSARARTPA
jgi:succinate dehydrogenase/fumarate reductase flavoprotein subunit